MSVGARKRACCARLIFSLQTPPLRGRVAVSWIEPSIFCGTITTTLANYGRGLSAVGTRCLIGTDQRA